LYTRTPVGHQLFPLPKHDVIARHGNIETGGCLDFRGRKFGEPFELKYQASTPVIFKPNDFWSIRGPGVIVQHPETTDSVWLMKLPN